MPSSPASRLLGGAGGAPELKAFLEEGLQRIEAAQQKQLERHLQEVSFLLERHSLMWRAPEDPTAVSPPLAGGQVPVPSSRVGSWRPPALRGQGSTASLHIAPADFTDGASGGRQAATGSHSLMRWKLSDAQMEDAATATKQNSNAGSNSWKEDQAISAEQAEQTTPTWKDFAERQSQSEHHKEAIVSGFVRRIQLTPEGGLAEVLHERAQGLNEGRLKTCLLDLAQWFHWWKTLEEPKHESNRINRLVKSHTFETLTVLVITFNGLFIALETNFEIANLNAKSPTWMLASEIAFLIFYMFELLLKFAASGRYFFCGKDMTWNLFDTFLVVISIVDYVGSTGSMDLTFMRMLRFFKFAKIFRMLRILRFFRDLKLMVDCVLGSFVQLFWCLLMILFLLYMFALFFVQDLTEHLEMKDIDQEKIGEIMHQFGSVEAAMLSLFQTTTGGKDWEEVYELLEKSGWLSAVAFLFFITFFIIAVWNIVTSTFVEKALKFAQPDIDTLMMDKRRKDLVDAKELGTLFKKIECNGKDTITKEAFTKCVEKPDFEAFLQTRGIDIKEAKTFFQMITATPDMDGDEVDIGTIVGSCIRIKGFATSIDLHTLHYETRMMMRQMTRSFDYIDTRFNRLETSLANFFGIPALATPPSPKKLRTKQ